MRNFIQPGDSLPVVVPYAGGLLAGQRVLVSALFGVAAKGGAQNATAARVGSSAGRWPPPAP